MPAAVLPLDPPASAADTPAPLVRLTDVGVRLGGRPVLERVSIDLARREIVTLIGPNGAGKTTLARVVLGLVKPSSGRVERGRGITVGYVPQRLAVDHTLPLTVRRLMTLTRHADRATVDGHLAEVGAAALADRAVQSLSGGEMQRVLLARALLGDPDLLVLDEPTQNVDYQGQAEFYELIVRIRDRHGCGILLISHDLHVVMAATDRVICLNRHVCCAGSPEAVSADPAYRMLFGPRAADSMALYRHAHAHRHAIDGAVVPAPAEAGGCGHDHDHGHDHGHDPAPSKQAR